VGPASRHPNYFGEIILWLGMYVLCAGGLDVWRAAAGALSPAFVGLLLVFVSGIPPAGAARRPCITLFDPTALLPSKHFVFTTMTPHLFYCLKRHERVVRSIFHQQAELTLMPYFRRLPQPPPTLERSADRRFGHLQAYQAYKRATSVLVPRPPCTKMLV
jgi:hypothetical protein